MPAGSLQAAEDAAGAARLTHNPRWWPPAWQPCGQTKWQHWLQGFLHSSSQCGGAAGMERQPTRGLRSPSLLLRGSGGWSSPLRSPQLVPVQGAAREIRPPGAGLQSCELLTHRKAAAGTAPAVPVVPAGVGKPQNNQAACLGLAAACLNGSGFGESFLQLSVSTGQAAGESQGRRRSWRCLLNGMLLFRVLLCFFSLFFEHWKSVTCLV